MKEQRILFETAKLAKEKGFNFGLWEDFETHRDGWEGVMNNSVYCPMSAKYPTQSLLQKYIWEKHTIWVQSTPVFTANEMLYIEVTISSWKFPFIMVEYDGFDVYEGLEKGLQGALELINTQK